jgi:hypothetical protein
VIVIFVPMCEAVVIVVIILWLRGESVAIVVPFVAKP